MSEKGFSLVELMGIIVILSVISVLVIPNIDRSIRNFKTKAYNSQIENIRIAAKDWASDNLGKYELPLNESINVSLYQLQTGGYLEEEVLNPKTDAGFPEETEVLITRVKDSLKYEVIESGSSTESPPTTYAPIITLNGPYVEIVPTGGIYTEKGYTATDYSRSNELTSSINKRYYRNNPKQSITSATFTSATTGSYTIEYYLDVNVNDYSYKGRVSRLVIKK